MKTTFNLEGNTINFEGSIEELEAFCALQKKMAQEGANLVDSLKDLLTPPRGNKSDISEIAKRYLEMEEFLGDDNSEEKTYEKAYRELIELIGERTLYCRKEESAFMNLWFTTFINNMKPDTLKTFFKTVTPTYRDKTLSQEEMKQLLETKCHESKRACFYAIINYCYNSEIIYPLDTHNKELFLDPATNAISLLENELDCMLNTWFDSLLACKNEEDEFRTEVIMDFICDFLGYGLTQESHCFVYDTYHDATLEAKIGLYCHVHECMTKYL